MSEPSDNLNQKQQARLFTPLEEGALLLKSFEGTEQLSRLFKFTFQLYCPTKKKTEIEFEKLLGKDFTIECDIYDRGKEERTDEYRYFSGICFALTEGLQDFDFTSYTVEIVPKVQLLTMQVRSRIFQQKTVLDILKEVLPKAGVEYQVTGNFEKREYCVQYRESDFDFASRLMEEEGIFYYFKFEKQSHTMVLANEAAKHPKVKKPDLVDLDPTEGGNRRAAHVSAWAKIQRLKTGKYTLWDHHFQLPTANLEAKKTTQESAKVGKVDHKLKVGGNENLEIYDFPGGYAKRVDGINKSGGEQPSELQTVHTDNQRTVKLRMEAETTQAVLIHAESNCVNFVAGHKFSIEESDASKDFKGDGDYVLTELKHELEMAVGYRTGEQGRFAYANKFTCVPLAINYRPQRTTHKPTVMGVQSATVVGPSGEEIFTDKYGRVKVQFRWDREGKNDANSSCWLRVVTPWAGKQWGMIHIPRIGQEVIVDFLEGDPDAPIIVGSVYNPNTMPPYTLPDNKTQSGIKTRSSKGGTGENFNEIRFEDKKGSELLYIHAELDHEGKVERDRKEDIGRDKTQTVGKDRDTTVMNNDTEKVMVNQSITVGVGQDEKIGAQRSTTIGATDTLTVAGAQTINVGAARSVTVGGADSLSSGGAVSITSGGVITITSGGAITITASAAIAITAPAILLNGRPVAPLPPGTPI